MSTKKKITHFYELNNIILKEVDTNPYLREKRNIKEKNFDDYVSTNIVPEYVTNNSTD